MRLKISGLRLIKSRNKFQKLHFSFYDKMSYICVMPKIARQTTKEFYECIQQEYRRMSSPDKSLGVQKYTDRYIFAKLAKKYFRSPSTIEAIVYGRV